MTFHIDGMFLHRNDFAEAGIIDPGFCEKRKINKVKLYLATIVDACGPMEPPFEDQSAFAGRL
ncbi:hypothetical protein [Bremerella sp. P1]|uniref:hypothetical protein n=1 Tax=Bremerella sp. P1 TaxID=3026424 RepID=UPI0023688A1E|nr:hypothetical protein [Bremerella sp. P1]WDI43500.1 hypothetical protein PSR63_06015 [Bremerella sp. P1]